MWLEQTVLQIQHSPRALTATPRVVIYQWSDHNAVVSVNCLNKVKQAQQTASHP